MVVTWWPCLVYCYSNNLRSRHLKQPLQTWNQCIAPSLASWLSNPHTWQTRSFYCAVDQGQSLTVVMTCWQGASTTALIDQEQPLTMGNDLLPNSGFNQVRTPTTISFRNTNTTFMFLNSTVTILGSVFFKPSLGDNTNSLILIVRKWGLLLENKHSTNLEENETLQQKPTWGQHLPITQN